jgi:hypothetical protein
MKYLLCSDGDNRPADHDDLCRVQDAERGKVTWERIPGTVYLIQKAATDRFYGFYLTNPLKDPNTFLRTNSRRIPDEFPTNSRRIPGEFPGHHT